MTVDIGDVTKATGLPASTLHVWEKRGLIHPVGRASGRRQFDPSVLDRIATIVLMQRCGFQLDEISELLEPDAFEQDKSLLTRKAEALREQRRQLDQAIDGIEHAIRCPEPSPLECPGFLAHLDGVLPVRPSQRTRIGSGNETG